MGLCELGLPVRGLRASRVPRTPQQKIAGAAVVRRDTGFFPTVARHILCAGDTRFAAAFLG